MAVTSSDLNTFLNTKDEDYTVYISVATEIYDNTVGGVPTDTLLLQLSAHYITDSELKEEWLGDYRVGFKSPPKSAYGTLSTTKYGRNAIQLDKTMKLSKIGRSQSSYTLF